MNLQSLKSPYTGSTNIELIKSYSPSLTSDGKIVDGKVDNWLCCDTGITFSDSSLRGGEQQFYMDQYELSSESAEAEIVFFDQSNGKGMYADIVDFIFGGTNVKDVGRILDVGCGKGLLLKNFKRIRPDWSCSAVEPSKNAVSYFRKLMPDVNVFEGTLEDAPFHKDKFDIICANGVLEHVPNPKAFLQTLRSLLSESGVIYIGVPNFENNPFDLFTFDHLNRFSSFNIETLFRNSGLQVLSSQVSKTRVPMWYLLTPSQSRPNDFSRQHVEMGRSIALNSVKIIENFFTNYNMAVQESDRDGRPIAVYGTSGIGLIGTRYTALTEDRIDQFFDDNQTLWGHQRLGVEICKPDMLRNSPADHVVISASPCYVHKIYEKIKMIAPEKRVYTHGLL